MPEEPIYLPERKKQLEDNIQKMLDNGMSKDDIQAYAKEFKSKFANKPVTPATTEQQKPTESTEETRVPFLQGSGEPSVRPTTLGVQSSEPKRENVSVPLVEGGGTKYPTPKDLAPEEKTKAQENPLYAYASLESELSKVNKAIEVIDLKKFGDFGGIGKILGEPQIPAGERQKLTARRDELQAKQKSYTEQIIKPYISEDIINKNFDNLVTESIYDVKIPNIAKITEDANKIKFTGNEAIDNGLRARYIDEVKGIVDFKIKVPQEELDQKTNDLFKEKYGKTPEDYFESGYKESVNKEVKPLLDNFTVKQTQLANTYGQAATKEYQTKAAPLQQEVTLAENEYTAKFEELQMLAERNPANAKEYQTQLDKAYSSLKSITEKNNEKLMEINNEVNTRYNQEFRNQTRRLEEETNRQITEREKEFSAKYKGNEEAIKDLNTFYKKAAGDIYGEANKAIDYLQKTNNYTGGRFINNSLSSLGGTMAGWAGALGMSPEVGQRWEQYFGVDVSPMKGFKDMTIDNVIESSGQLAGAMLPTALASLAAGAATGNAPLATRIAVTGIAGFLTESADIVGRAYVDNLAKTGSEAQAKEAASETWDGQMMLLPTYGAGALPFVRGLSAIKNMPTRVLLGAGAELAEETIQEYTQNLQQTAIENSGEWTNMFDYASLGQQEGKVSFEETFVNVLPTAVLGGTGAIDGGKKPRIPAFDINAPLAYIPNLVANGGTVQAKAAITSLYQDGRITKEEFEDMGRQIELAVSNEPNGLEYSSLANLAQFQRERIENTSDEVQKAALKEKLKDTESAMMAVLKGQPSQTIKGESGEVNGKPIITYTPLTKEQLKEREDGKTKETQEGTVRNTGEEAAPQTQENLEVAAEDELQNADGGLGDVESTDNYLNVDDITKTENGKSIFSKIYKEKKEGDVFRGVESGNLIPKNVFFVSDNPLVAKEYTRAENTSGKYGRTNDKYNKDAKFQRYSIDKNAKVLDAKTIEGVNELRKILGLKPTDKFQGGWAKVYNLLDGISTENAKKIQDAGYDVVKLYESDRDTGYSSVEGDSFAIINKDVLKENPLKPKSKSLLSKESPAKTPTATKTDTVKQPSQVKADKATTKDAAKQTPEDKLSQAWNKWKQKQQNTGIIYDPKSKAKEDVELFEAVIEYIKEKSKQGVYTLKEFINDAAALGIESEGAKSLFLNNHPNLDKKVVTDYISELEKEGSVSTKKAASLMGRVANTNMSNPKQVEKLINSIEETFDKAKTKEVQKRVQGKLKKAAKKAKSVGSLSNEVRVLRDIDTKKIDDLNLLTELEVIADEVLSSTTPKLTKGELSDISKRAESKAKQKTTAPITDRIKNNKTKREEADTLQKQLNAEYERQELLNELEQELLEAQRSNPDAVQELEQSIEELSQENEIVIDSPNVSSKALAVKSAGDLAKAKRSIEKAFQEGRIDETKRDELNTQIDEAIKEYNVEVKKRTDELSKDYAEARKIVNKEGLTDVEKAEVQLMLETPAFKNLLWLERALDVIDSINNGVVPYKEISVLRQIAAYNSERAVEVSNTTKNMNDRGLGRRALTKLLGTKEASQKERNIFNNQDGILTKIIWNPMNNMFNRVHRMAEAILKPYHKASDPSFWKLSPKNPFKNGVNGYKTASYKIGMLSQYLREQSMAGQGKVADGTDVGNRDIFGIWLGNEAAMDAAGMTPEMKENFKGGIAMRNYGDKNKQAAIKKIYEGLPKNEKGYVDVANLKPEDILTSSELKWFEASRVAFNETEALGEAANLRKGRDFKAQAFYVPTLRIGRVATSDPTQGVSGTSIKIQAKTGLEKTTESLLPTLGVYEVDINAMVATVVSETTTDYVYSETHPEISAILNKAVKDNKQNTVAQAVKSDYNESILFEQARAQGSASRLANTGIAASYAYRLYDPIRTAVEVVAALTSIPVKVKSFGGYIDIVNKESWETLRALEDFTGANIADFKSGQVERKSLEEGMAREGLMVKGGRYVMGFPEYLTAIMGYMPIFRREFKSITGIEFDAKQFKDSPAYKETYSQAIKDASSEAQNRVERMYGSKNKGASRRWVEFAPSKILGISITKDGSPNVVAADTVAGKLISYFGSFAYREQGEFFKSLEFAAKNVKNLEGKKALDETLNAAGVLTNAVTYAYGMSMYYLSYQLALAILNGDDEEEKETLEKIKQLHTAEGQIESLSSQLAFLGLSKYGKTARIAAIATLSKIYYDTDDKELKEQIYSLMEKNLYKKPINSSNKFSVGGLMAEELLPATMLIVNSFTKAAEAVNKIKANEDLNDEDMQALMAVDAGITIINLYLTTKGSQLPMTKRWEQFVREKVKSSENKTKTNPFAITYQ